MRIARPAMAEAAVMTVQSCVSPADSSTPWRMARSIATVQMKWAMATAAVTPRNLPIMKDGLPMGFDSTVVTVFDSISSVTAPAAAKIAMNKPERNSVERQISRRSLMS